MSEVVVNMTTYRCEACKVTIRQAGQPLCPICRVPMPEEARRAEVTQRIRRCCLGGRK